MTNPIPEDVKKVVWRIYLTDGGMSLGDIASLVGIGKTSVFNIVRGYEKEEPNIPLMRALIENLCKDGSDIKQYSQVIRLFNVFKRYGIDYGWAQEMMESLLLECYKENITAVDAVEYLKQASWAAKNIGFTFKLHRDYIRNLVKKVNELESKIRELKEEEDKYDLLKNIREDNSNTLEE